MNVTEYAWIHDGKEGVGLIVEMHGEHHPHDADGHVVARTTLPFSQIRQVIEALNRGSRD